jgi:hypothetical protein
MSNTIIGKGSIAILSQLIIRAYRLKHAWRSMALYFKPRICAAASRIMDPSTIWQDEMIC